MFDLGALELLVIVIVAVIVIGPKDMPLAMRTAGRWIGKVRKVSAHFRTGIDAMVREAELEDMEKKWKARNEEIMRKHPTGDEPSASASAPTAESAAETMTGPPTVEGKTPEAGTNPASTPEPPADSAGRAEKA